MSNLVMDFKNILFIYQRLKFRFKILLKLNKMLNNFLKPVITTKKINSYHNLIFYVTFFSEN